MWQKIIAWIREAWSKMIGTSNVKQALNVDVALSPYMVDALQTWAGMYINQSPWLVNDIKSLNLAAGIATEVARAVTIEAEITVTGSARANFLQAQLQQILNRLRITTEYATAKGGLMFKPYINNAGELTVDLVQADQFYPVAFDANGKMTSCVFSDQKTMGGAYYTRLEFHALLADGYHITNTAWRSSAKDTLGNKIPLTQVAEWAELMPEATIANVKAPLFAYFKMPFANNIDPTSPLGVSIYSRAVDLIKQADQQWTDFLWEFESGKRALYTDPMAFARDDNNKPILPDRRLYRLLDLQGKIDKQGLFEDWTPTLREINILNGLDAILRRIEFNCGLSYGILSDPEVVALTATEINAGKQRYYSTVVDIQKSLQVSIDGLLYAMDVWTTLGNLAPNGSYSVVYWWDDSIVADHDTAFTQDSQAISLGVMSKIEFRMRNYGEDEATARRMVAMVDEEKKSVSFFNENAGV